MDNYLKAIFYGRSGVGKTVFSVGAEDYGHTLIIDTEGGTKFARLKKPTLSVFVPESFIDINTVYNKLFDHFKYVKMWNNAKDENKKQFEAKLIDLEKFFSGNKEATTWRKIEIVIIDSASKAQEISLNKVRPQDNMEDPTKRQIQDWNTSHDMMKLMFDFFIKLPCHVVFTSLYGVKENEEGQVIKTLPLFQGKDLAEKLCAKVDVVGYLTTSKIGGVVKRKMQFEEANTIVCKDRTDVLGKEQYDMTFKSMMEKIYGIKQDV